MDILDRRANQISPVIIQITLSPPQTQKNESSI